MNTAYEKPAALMAALVWLWGSVLGATEFSATHAVFEKATKMKRVKVSLILAALDQSSPADTLGDARRLRCAVAAFGKGGELPAKGNLTLRLEGLAQDDTMVWVGNSLSQSLDSRGAVVFDEEALSGLVSQALEENAKPARFRVDFKGGKGKKVADATLDCVHELTGGAG